jgi:hypothetical protein
MFSAMIILPLKFKLLTGRCLFSFYIYNLFCEKNLPGPTKNGLAKYFWVLPYMDCYEGVKNTKTPDYQTDS